MSTPQKRDSVYDVRCLGNGIRQTNDHKGHFGYVVTPVGIVHAETRRMEQLLSHPRPDAGWTDLTFVWKGRRYTRIVYRAYTAVGLVTVAGRFARAVAAGKVRRT